MCGSRCATWPSISFSPFVGYCPRDHCFGNLTNTPKFSKTQNYRFLLHLSPHSCAPFQSIQWRLAPSVTFSIMHGYVTIHLLSCHAFFLHQLRNPTRLVWFSFFIYLFFLTNINKAWTHPFSYLYLMLILSDST